MRLLEKYIIKNFLSAFIFCIVLLMVLGIIGDILGFIDDIFKNNISFLSIISFYFYLIPFAFVNMVPFASLLSSVYVFNHLSKNQEITAIITSGVSLIKLLKPVLFITFIFCLFAFIVNEKIVPYSIKKANSIRQREFEIDEKKNKGMTDIAIYGKGEQMIFVKKFDIKKNILHDVIIHKQNKEHVVYKKINATIVKWNDENKHWIGENVVVFSIDSFGNFSIEPVVYKERYIDIQEKPKDFENTQYDPKYMSYKQLKEYLKMFKKESSITIRRLLVDLNYKISFPFAALITVFLSIPFSIETGRASALIGMARGILIGMLYLPVMAVSLALGKSGVLSPFLSAWLSFIVCISIGMFFIYKRS